MDVFGHGLECAEVHQTAVGLAQYFHVEMFLPAKVVIDCGGVDPGKVANLPRRRTFETLFGEYDAGSLEKAAAGPMIAVLKISIFVRSGSFSFMAASI